MEYYGKWKQGKSFGQGGASNTYICTSDDDSSHEYVLKLLSSSSSGKGERFDNEIKIISQIKHQGIIKIKDNYLNYINLPEKKWYVMCKGTSLYDILDSHLKNQKNNGYEMDFIIKIFKNTIFLFKTLDFLHKKGIFHRDIKPENLVFHNKNVKFIDFGIAKHSINSSNITQIHDKNGLGAKFYMAPEMRREPLNADYSKADIYSLTKTLWAILTGNFKSFDGEYSLSSNNFLSSPRMKQFSQTITNTNYLNMLHNFFKKNTSNNVNERMNINDCISELENFLYFALTPRNGHLHSLNFECETLIKSIFTFNFEKIDCSFTLLTLDDFFIKLINKIYYLDFVFDSQNLDITFYDKYLINNDKKELYKSIQIFYNNDKFDVLITTENDKYNITY